ncbi:hypothetical protein OF83DRAFT_1176630 [Amylostereum chailletii]|nr:hypothetical protein OF83DRAFT_1176630 [Amylostereum chailletii]
MWKQTLNIIANITPLLGSFSPYLIHIVTQLTAMYPTLIILIVFLRKSHGYGNSELPSDATMAFAHRAPLATSPTLSGNEPTVHQYL